MSVPVPRLGVASLLCLLVGVDALAKPPAPAPAPAAPAPAPVAPECPSRLARLDLMDAIEQAVGEGDLDAAKGWLRELEDMFACGTLAESEQLGRMWLARGAVVSLSGDPRGAEDYWRAAARVAPGRWVDSYGEVLRAQYEAALQKGPRGTTTMVLDPPLFEWMGAVDGRVVQFPATVPVGLHVVQVGASELDVRFSRVVTCEYGTPAIVKTGLAEPSNFVGVPPPTDGTGPKVRGEPRPPPVVALYAGGGADLSLGREVKQGDDVEPATKILLPLEWGLVIRPSAGWLRFTGVAGPLVDGAFVHEDRYGPTASPVALGGALAGGLVAQQGDIGLMAGYRWPDRVPVRVVVAGRAARFPVQLEGRLGMNVVLAAERSPEPGFEAVVAFTPGLVMRER